MQAASLAGDKTAAATYRSELRLLCAHADLPGRAELADIR